MLLMLIQLLWGPLAAALIAAQLPSELICQRLDLLHALIMLSFFFVRLHFCLDRHVLRIVLPHVGVDFGQEVGVGLELTGGFNACVFAGFYGKFFGFGFQSGFEHWFQTLGF